MRCRYFAKATDRIARLGQFKVLRPPNEQLSIRPCDSMLSVNKGEGHRTESLSLVAARRRVRREGGQTQSAYAESLTYTNSRMISRSSSRCTGRLLKSGMA